MSSGHHFLPAIFQRKRAPSSAEVFPALFVALVLVVLVSLLFPPDHSLWLDEMDSYFFASLPWSSLFEILGKSQANMSLYYILLKLHTSGVAADAYHIRGLSLLFGVLALICLYFFCRQQFDRRLAFIVLIVAAFNPFLYSYFWEARSYSLTLLFGIILLWLFWLAISENRRIFWLLYGALAGLSLYSHILVVLLIVAQFGFAIAYMAVHRNFSSYIFNLLLAGCTLVIVATPILYFFITVGSEAHNVDWIKPVGISSILGFFKNILKSNASWNLFSRVSTVLLLFTCATLVIRGTAREFQADRLSRRAFLILYLGICTLGPVFMLYLIQLAKPLFQERYLIFVAPGLLILCCWSILGFTRPPLRQLLLLTIGLIQVQGLYATYHKVGWGYDELYQTLANDCVPHSKLVFMHSFLPHTYYYYQQQYPQLKLCFGDMAAGLQLPKPGFYSTGDAEKIEQALLSGQLWFIDGHNDRTGRSNSKTYNANFLEQKGYVQVFAKAYPIDLELIQLSRTDR